MTNDEGGIEEKSEIGLEEKSEVGIEEKSEVGSRKSECGMRIDGIASRNLF
jgi:hypothetical protein